MTGGKSTPKKDKAIKIGAGQYVKIGQILVRGMSNYKAGSNVEGINTLHALSNGKISFSKKKTPGGRVRTFINIIP
jgi:ribosomal protein L27